MNQPVQYNSTSERRVVPLILGAVYQVIPSMGGQYIQLVRMDSRYAYAVGFGNNTADIKVRLKRFPEIVIKIVGYGTEGYALRLTSEDGYVLMLSGDRIRLTNQGDV